MFCLDLTLVKHDSSSLGLWTQPCWHCQDSSQSWSQDRYQEQGTCKVCFGINIFSFKWKMYTVAVTFFVFTSDSLISSTEQYDLHNKRIKLIESEAGYHIFFFESITYGLVKTTRTLKTLVRLTSPTKKVTCVYFKTFWQPWRSHVIPSQTRVSWQVPAKTHFLV